MAEFKPCPNCESAWENVRILEKDRQRLLDAVDRLTAGIFKLAEVVKVLKNKFGLEAV